MSKTNAAQLSVIAIGLTLASVALHANAGVVFDNGPMVAVSTHCAETSGACGGQWTVFDNFSLSGSTTVTGIGWSVRAYGGRSDLRGVKAWIYSADPVLSGGVLLAQIPEQTGAPVANGALYDVMMSGLSIDLEPGTYWLGMQIDTSVNYASVGAANPNAGTATQWQNGGTGDRGFISEELSFKILGDIHPIPEPNSLALLGFGLAGLAVCRRKRCD